jgi:hypothetical protein
VGAIEEIHPQINGPPDDPDTLCFATHPHVVPSHRDARYFETRFPQCGARQWSVGESRQGRKLQKVPPVHNSRYHITRGPAQGGL